MIPDTLYGKEIFVGRESGSDRLLVYLSINGQIKAFQIGSPGSVPKSVSRAIPNQKKAHLLIKIDNTGNITVTNLKPENVTFVNGSQIVSKRVSEDDRIEMGTAHYLLPLNQILTFTSQLTTSQLHNSLPDTSHLKPEAFNISHLEKVWDDYKNGLKEIKDKQKKINLVRSGCGIFTMCAMPTIFFLGPIGYILTGIGVIGNAYSFLGMKRNDPEEEKERLIEVLEKNYICPNPDCKRYFGVMKYSLLKSQHHMSCPYCKSKFVE